MRWMTRLATSARRYPRVNRCLMGTNSPRFRDAIDSKYGRVWQMLLATSSTRSLNPL